jgi:hypothetical protein
MHEKGFIKASALLVLGALTLGLVLLSGPVHAKPGVSLEQCRNGSFDAPNDCPDGGGGSGWVSGNAGASNAHFSEGQSIPYRLIMTDLPTGTSITLDLAYDVKHSSKFALDFLTHYDRLPDTAVDPFSDVSGTSATLTTQAITGPSTGDCDSDDDLADELAASFASVPPAEKVMTLQGGTLSGFAYVSQGCLSDAQAETRIQVTFTADSSTAVLAWGGHIAASVHWGAGNAASGISGSPYHMRTKTWSLGNLGNQDRSLAAAAVVAVPSTNVTTIFDAADDTEIALNSSVALGTTVYDSATVTGNNPTGTVTFTFYSGDCTGTVLATDADKALVGGIATSDDHGPLAAGAYAFQASYSGDGFNDPSVSGCEPFSVSKGTLTISTVIHLGDDHDTNYDANVVSGASVPVDSAVHDVANVSGQAGSIAPTGTISFTTWSNGTCEGTGSTLATQGDDSGGGTRSVDTAALSPGQYSFKASIAADDNYETATSDCERLVVDQAASSLTTAPWVYPNDSATVSGLVNPQTGSSLTFTAYTDAACDGPTLYTRTFSDIVNGTYDTDNTATKVTSDTVVYWVVEYSGDTNNTGATSDCVESIAIDITTDEPIP